MTIGKVYLYTLSCSLFICQLQAQITCTEVSAQVGIGHHYLSVTPMGGGAAFFDFDNDGDEDLWIAGGLNRDVLYENDGAGSFTEVGMAAGLSATNGHVTTGVVTADLDNDGYRDVLVMPHIGFHPLLFKNNGNSTFSEISDFAGLSDYPAQSYAAAFGDVNLDGYLDIYIANYTERDQLIYDNNGTVIGFEHDCHGNWLFINNGDWTFTETGASAGVANEGCALATTFTDFDLDTDPDILLANDFGAWVSPNALFENTNSNHQFSDISQPSGMDVAIYGMGIATGDYDRDLDLDYYITNLGRNVLLENQGNLTFADKSTEAGVEDTFMDTLLATGWGTAFLDVDNDADLDLFVCNGYVPAAPFIANHKDNRNRLFLNNGNPEEMGFSFEEAAFDSGLDDAGRGRGFACSDYDNDGDMDFLVVNVNRHTSGDPIENVLLYRNDLDSVNNWLKIKLEGVTNNRDAFGSTIKIVANGHAWIHDYNGGFGSHASQHSSTAHFGLGNTGIVDSLIVTWPGGAQSRLANISANQLLKIAEDGTVTGMAKAANEPGNVQLNVFPNPLSGETKIQFQLPESGYIELDIFDPLGRKIKTLSSDWFAAGTHSIDWTLQTAISPSGWFLVRLKTDNQIVVQKLINKR